MNGGVLEGSDVELDGAGGGVDAGLDEVAFLAVHLAGAPGRAPVRRAAGSGGPADAHPAAAGHDDPADPPTSSRWCRRGVASLSDFSNWTTRRPAGAGQQRGGEAFDDELVVEVLATPVLGRGVEHLGGTAEVGRPGPPVRADHVEVTGLAEVDPAAIAEPRDHGEAVVAVREVEEPSKKSASVRSREEWMRTTSASVR